MTDFTKILSEYSAPMIMGICVCIGYIIKKAVPSDSINRFIPLIVGCLGVGLNAWINLSFSPSIVLVGLVSGLASTGMYEALGQMLNKK